MAWQNKQTSKQTFNRTMNTQNDLAFQAVNEKIKTNLWHKIMLCFI